VYLELLGGRQATFALGTLGPTMALAARPRQIGSRPRTLPPRLTAEDVLAHRAFVAGLGVEPIWNRYRSVETLAAA
jgi:DNA polymerase-3 subunit epsilon